MKQNYVIGALILANTLGTKITSILGIRVSVGIFFVPILFLVTDIIAEVHGRKKAQSFVFIALIIMAIVLQYPLLAGAVAVIAMMTTFLSFVILDETIEERLDK